MLIEKKKKHMSDRRMCSNRIVKSSRFLQMPLESQALYFHLIINADDDGVVEAYPVVRLLGTAPDSLKVLLSKNLVIQLNEDQVMLVTDWLEHNKIRPDRKKDSIYKHLLPIDTLVIKARPRADRGNKNTGIIGRPKKGQPMDGISKVKLGKAKVSKIKIHKDCYGEFQNVFLTKAEYERLVTVWLGGNESLVNELIFDLGTYMKSRGKSYKDHYATILNWAKRKHGEAKIKQNSRCKEIVGL